MQFTVVALALLGLTAAAPQPARGSHHLAVRSASASVVGPSQSRASGSVVGPSQSRATGSAGVPTPTGGRAITTGGAIGGATTKGPFGASGTLSGTVVAGPGSTSVAGVGGGMASAPGNSAGGTLGGTIVIHSGTALSGGLGGTAAHGSVTVGGTVGGSIQSTALVGCLGGEKNGKGFTECFTLPIRAAEATPAPKHN